MLHFLVTIYFLVYFENGAFFTLFFMWRTLDMAPILGYIVFSLCHSKFTKLCLYLLCQPRIQGLALLQLRKPFHNCQGFLL